MKDYYKILGVTKNSKPEEIKKAFRALARKYHPDQNQGNKEAEDKFREINEAYNVLSDEELKKRYDEDPNNVNKEKKTQSSGKEYTADIDWGSFFNKSSNAFEEFCGFDKDNKKVKKDGSKDPLNVDDLFENFFKVRK